MMPGGSHCCASRIPWSASLLALPASGSAFIWSRGRWAHGRSHEGGRRRMRRWAPFPAFAMRGGQVPQSAPPQLLWQLSSLVPSLMFALRLRAAACLALYTEFWLQLDYAYWAATSVAIVLQPSLGASLRRSWVRVGPQPGLGTAHE